MAITGSGVSTYMYVGDTTGHIRRFNLERFRLNNDDWSIQNDYFVTFGIRYYGFCNNYNFFTSILWKKITDIQKCEDLRVCHARLRH
jgi:hypothetical protein